LKTIWDEILEKVNRFHRLLLERQFMILVFVPQPRFLSNRYAI
jgi:hypothetical protein